MNTNHFLALLSPVERAVLENLRSPKEIQAFLDTLVYPTQGYNRSVSGILAERQAHCLDGGVFAAAALTVLGFAPILIDLRPEPEIDDDHVLAVYKQDGGWGCLAKSNFPLLRRRNAVHRSLRELVMTYFEAYLNVDTRQITLRGYTRPLNLARPGTALGGYNPITDSRAIDALETWFKHARRVPLLSSAQIANLQAPDDWYFDTTVANVQNWDGVFRNPSAE
jgi:hypothetical protein